MLANVIMVGVTWLKTFQQYREARRLDITLSVSACLLRDGVYGFDSTLRHGSPTRTRNVILSVSRKLSTSSFLVTSAHCCRFFLQSITRHERCSARSHSSNGQCIHLRQRLLAMTPPNSMHSRALTFTISLPLSLDWYGVQISLPRQTLTRRRS